MSKTQTDSSQKGGKDKSAKAHAKQASNQGKGPSKKRYGNSSKSGGKKKALKKHSSQKNAPQQRTPSRKKRFSPDPKLNLEGAFGMLTQRIQRAIDGAGYQSPTPIQEQAIPLLLDDRDLIGMAQTGTGKTAAFTLPLLNHLDGFPKPRSKRPVALILAPTRELAAQIGESVEVYSSYMRTTHTVIFGGVNQRPQVQALDKGVDILVATPGRLLDLMGQGHINLEDVEFFILDEVDRMLDMGFIHDIRRVLREVPEDRQTLFFSATLPPKIETLAQEMVYNPARVSIAPEQPAVERIEQRMMFVNRKSKIPLLIDLLDDDQIGKTIVFTQMKHVANRVSEKLGKAGLRAAAIHGNKSQSARTKALNGFRGNSLDVLVATDVAARGIDVQDVTHVINYDLPVEAETYVHRIGRTARAGADGMAYSFCTADDQEYLRAIEKLLGKAIPVDSDHEFHDEQARISKKPAKSAGKTGGKGRWGRKKTVRGWTGKKGGKSPAKKSSSGGRR